MPYAYHHHHHPHHHNHGYLESRLEAVATPAPMDLSLGSSARRQMQLSEKDPSGVDLTFRKRKVISNPMQPDKMSKLEEVIKKEPETEAEAENEDVEVDVETEQPEEHKLPSKQVKLFKPYLLDEDDEEEREQEDLDEGAGEEEEEQDDEDEYRDADDDEVVAKEAADKKQRRHKKKPAVIISEQREPIIWSNHPYPGGCLSPGSSTASFQCPTSVVQQQQQQQQTFPVGGSPNQQFQDSKAATPLSPFSAPALSPTGFCCPKGSPVSGYESSSSTYSDSGSNYSLNLQLHAVYNDNLMYLQQQQQQQQQHHLKSICVCARVPECV